MSRRWRALGALPFLAVLGWSAVAPARPAWGPLPGQDHATRAELAPWASWAERLAAVERGERRVLRVAHFGDSEVSDDLVARTLRERFGARLGHAGPGFALAARPWAWYNRRGWVHESAKGWTARAISRERLLDGQYGPGGVALEATGEGASAEVRLEPAVEGSCEVRFFFARQPEGAPLRLEADEQASLTVETSGGPGVLPSDVVQVFASCPQILRVTQAGPGRARVFGWLVERHGAGVVWSSLGVVAARAPHLSRFDGTALAHALGRLRPDLLVFSFGLNSASFPRGPSANYGAQVERALRHVRGAAPSAACVVVAPYPLPGPAGGTSRIAGRVSTRLGEAAEAVGCAWIDRHALVAASGGFERWRASQPPRLKDNVHLSISGSTWMGEALYPLLAGEVPDRLAALRPPAE